MEHTDEQYMQSAEKFANNMENMQQQNQQQHLNVAGSAVVDNMLGVGVVGDVGSKYDEHQLAEEHDVGDDNELKYVKEVQQSEKQQNFKVFDDTDFAVKEKTFSGIDLLGNGDACANEMDDRRLFNFDSNRNENGIDSEYMKLKDDKEAEEEAEGETYADEEILGNGVRPMYENEANKGIYYNVFEADADLDRDGMRTDGEYPVACSFGESTDGDNVVPQVDVKIEAAVPQTFASEHDMPDEEEPSSLADNTTNGTSSLSENAPQPIIEEQVVAFPLETCSLQVTADHSQLNPDAKEFIPSHSSNPTSPTSPMPPSVDVTQTNKNEDSLSGAYFGQRDSFTNRHLFPDDDEFVAESPRKGQVEDMDSISLPMELTEFTKEADRRPHELQTEEFNELLNKETTSCNGNENPILNATEQMNSDQDEYDQPLPDNFNNRMASLLLEENEGVNNDNKEATEILQLQKIEDKNVSDKSNDDDDVMKRSVYITNDECIENILNTVQVLPTNIESDTSFNDNDNDDVDVDVDINDDNDNVINMNMVNKELLQVEEKEHVSHSPSTEEMNINLVVDNELNGREHLEEQQQSDVGIIGANIAAPMQLNDDIKEIELQNRRNNESEDDIIIVDEVEDEVEACISEARDASGMMYESNDDDHFSQEKDVENLTTTAIDLETEYHSSAYIEQDSQEQFERNLLNYMNEPLTDGAAEQKNAVNDDDVEYSPPKMVNTEMDLDNELLKEKSYNTEDNITDIVSYDKAPENNQMMMGEENIQEEVKQFDTGFLSNDVALRDKAPENNQMMMGEENIQEEVKQFDTVLGSNAEVLEDLKYNVTELPMESVNVEYALEATNEVTNEATNEVTNEATNDTTEELANEANDKKMSTIKFGESVVSSDIDYKCETETAVAAVEMDVEVIELDDTVISEEGSVNMTNEPIGPNEPERDELIASKLSENIILSEKTEQPLQPEEKVLQKEITELMSTEKTIPNEADLINGAGIVMPAVAATVTAAAVVGIAALETNLMKDEKKIDTSKKPSVAPTKASSSAGANKASKSAVAATSTKTVGTTAKKAVTTSTAKPLMNTTSKATAKPKVSSVEKTTAPEKKPMKAASAKTTVQSLTKTTTTGSVARTASARTVSTTATMKTKSALSTAAQKPGATASTTKTRPSTAPTSASTSTVTASAKPTSLGLSDAANGTAAKAKARSPRSMLTTQTRKTVPTTTAKSPVKPPSSTANGCASMKSSSATKPTQRTSGISTTSSSTLTTTKLFTARPAPKFTNPSVTTTTTSARRVTTTTTSGATSLTATNKANTVAMSKTSPSKFTTSTASSKTPFKTSTSASKGKSTTLAASTSKVSPSSKNTTPRAIKRPQQQEQQLSQPEQHQQLQEIKANSVNVQPTIDLVNGGGDYLGIECGNTMSNLMNGEPQKLHDIIDHEHKASSIALTDA